MVEVELCLLLLLRIHVHVHLSRWDQGGNTCAKSAIRGLFLLRSGRVRRSCVGRGICGCVGRGCMWMGTRGWGRMLRMAWLEVNVAKGLGKMFGFLGGGGNFVGLGLGGELTALCVSVLGG